MVNLLSVVLILMLSFFGMAAADDAEEDAEPTAGEEAAAESGAVEGVPKAKTWYQSLLDEGYALPFAPQRLLFMKLQDSVATVMPLNVKEFSKYGFMELVDPRELNYIHLLNPRGEKKPQTESVDGLVAEWFKSSMVDTIIVDEAEEGRWSIFHLDDKGKLVRAFKGVGPDSLATRKVFKWLMDKFGYTGVVLRTEGKYFLVGFFKGKAPRKQLVTIPGSDSLMVVPAEKRKGEHLLQEVDRWEYVSVFEAPPKGDAASVKQGTKILLPKKP